MSNFQCGRFILRLLQPLPKSTHLHMKQLPRESPIFCVIMSHLLPALEPVINRMVLLRESYILYLDLLIVKSTIGKNMRFLHYSKFLHFMI